MTQLMFRKRLVSKEAVFRGATDDEREKKVGGGIEEKAGE